MQALDKMLDDAMRGSFTEQCFDESMRSAVEAKLSQYLEASTVSARNLQAEKDKIKALISDISHQTKLPIANVLLYTQLLAEQDLPQECKPYITALEAQAEKLQMLIEALIKTSRLETGILALCPACGDLEPVIRSAAAQLGPKAAAKDIDLIIASCDGNAILDAKWTEEAVFNLLDNAVKYTPAGGSVSVSTCTYPLFACVTVTDTGPGFPRLSSQRCFSGSTGAHSTSPWKASGSGFIWSARSWKAKAGMLKSSLRPAPVRPFPYSCPGIEIFQN